MRTLHLVKTSDGARWAALQAKVLGGLGVEVHVALPAREGEAVPFWKDAGAIIHIVDTRLPIRSPWTWTETRSSIRELVTRVKPDIIHSHFVSTTFALRMAMRGWGEGIPRVFQVPGPLHLEHRPYRDTDIRSATQSDYWIASSRCIKSHYTRSGVSPDRLFLSYYGTTIRDFERQRSMVIRHQLGIPDDALVVGSLSYMYRPKLYVGQVKGFKRHEDLIDALGIICRERRDVVGLIIGGEWGGGSSYRDRLRRRASRVAGDQIRFVDRVPAASAAALWPEYDCVVHLAISENCGGVVEPLAAGVATVAARDGGLPEVVLDGDTGWLVPPRSPREAASVIQEALANPAERQRRAEAGRRLVLEMFDVQRTGAEIADIYAYILNPTTMHPREFDSVAAVRRLSEHNAEQEVMTR